MLLYALGNLATLMIKHYFHYFEVLHVCGNSVILELIFSPASLSLSINVTIPYSVVLSHHLRHESSSDRHYFLREPTEPGLALLY